MSFNAGMAVLIITAFIQALLQFVVFMHAGESEDKGFIYGKVVFMMFAAIVTILGTLLSSFGICKIMKRASIHLDALFFRVFYYDFYLAFPQ